MEILHFERKNIQKSYLTISILGTIYKLNIKYINSNSIELTKKDLSFELTMPKKYRNNDNIEIINHAIAKLYNEIAEIELEECLELARFVTKFAPEDYKIENLKNNYFKISKKVLTISPDIIQYNKEIINSSLIKAFCKMQFKSNTNAYKKALQDAMLNYENYKKFNTGKFIQIAI